MRSPRQRILRKTLDYFPKPANAKSSLSFVVPQFVNFKGTTYKKTMLKASAKSAIFLYRYLYD